MYRVPAASLKALGTAPEGDGSPDVELVTKGAWCGLVGVWDLRLDERWSGWWNSGMRDGRYTRTYIPIYMHTHILTHSRIYTHTHTALGKPNGLALSADETKLYVGESTFKNARCANAACLLVYVILRCRRRWRPAPSLIPPTNPSSPPPPPKK